MAGMIGFIIVILGAIAFASMYGGVGLFLFILFAIITTLFLRARKLRRI